MQSGGNERVAKSRHQAKPQERFLLVFLDVFSLCLPIVLSFDVFPSLSTSITTTSATCLSRVRVRVELTGALWDTPFESK